MSIRKFSCMFLKALYICCLVLLVFNYYNVNGNITERYLARFNNHTYLIHRGKYHLVPETLEQIEFSFQVDANDIRNISRVHFQSLSKGDNVPFINLKYARDIDDLMNRTVTVNMFLQGRLLTNITRIGSYINPSLMEFHGRFLMATCLTWVHKDMNENKDIEDRLQFRWFNHHLLPFLLNSNDSYLGLDEHIRDIANVTVTGQDPRLMPIGDDSFYAIFTNRFVSTHGVRMGFVEYYLNKKSQMIDTRRVITEIRYPGENSNQKNWIPFYWENTTNLVSHSAIKSANNKQVSPNIYFVQTINPLRVVMINTSDAIDDPRQKQIIPSYFVSEAPFAIHDYHYGELRGSTNAVDLGDRYLAMFHSVGKIWGSYLNTYFFGAFTFTKNPPFRLLSITNEPIMDESLYSGQWHPLSRNRKLDYVVFPVALRKIGHGKLLLSYGWQDIEGQVAMIDLRNLLAAMEPVFYCDNLSPSKANYAKKKKRCDEL